MIALIAGAVAFTFYAMLYGARIMVVLRARVDGMASLLRRINSALLIRFRYLKYNSGRYGIKAVDILQHGWINMLAFAKSAHAAVLPRLQLPPVILRPFFQLMLFGTVFSLGLVLLPPTHAKAPVPLQAPIQVFFAAKGSTPTPFRLVTQTPTITPTLTPTATLTPTITLTPTAHIKAVVLLPGPGNCGVVNGVTGTDHYIWPAVKHWLSGYNYTPSTGHSGIDIAGSLGDNIYAANAGVVIYAGWNYQGFGNLVVIDHGNGFQTVYAHLSQINVKCGASVQQGEVIGLMGSTGWSTGPHLHFEMMTNRMEHVNPWLYLER